MRKYFSLILLFAILPGCEKDFDGVIDVVSDNFQVTSISGIKDSIDLKNPSDSLLIIRLTFTNASQINNVYFSVYASDNSVLNSFPLVMNHIGNNIFDSQFILRSNNPIGNYSIKFSASGLTGAVKQVAVANFYFNNGQDNVAPVIYNTVVEPDTVVVTQPTLIFTSVEAADLNGLNDIDEVYFITYRPDGTTNNIKIALLDDGSCCQIPPTNQESGDITAGDGIYSRIISVDESNAKGTYRFEFQARDRSGLLSNIINHSVLIQ